MGKGNIIGVPNEPTVSVASGVWSLREQVLAHRDGVWPLYFIDGLQLWLDASDTNSYPDTGSTWYDISSSDFDASITGLVYTSDAGGGLTSGAGDQVNVPSGLDFSGGGFTMSVWVNHTSTTGVQRYFTIGSTPLEGPTIRNSSGAAHAYVFDSTSTIREITVASAISTSNYYNFVFTYDGTTFRLYKNNVEIGTLAVSVTLPTPNVATLGAGAEALMGNIYGAEYYNRALSTDEITLNYNRLKGRFGL